MNIKALSPVALWRRLSRDARLVITIIVAVLAFAAALLAVASRAVPGDTLYPVKRAAEDVRLSLILTKHGLARYSLERSRERLHEAQALLKEGKKEQARETIGEQEFFQEKAIEYAEFIEDDEQVDRIVDEAEKLRLEAIEVRRRVSPAFEGSE